MILDAVVPVITIDGPSASGKGTIAAALAQKLCFHHLDSGVLYRLVAYSILSDAQNTALSRDNILLHLSDIDITWRDGQYWLANHDVLSLLRTREIDEASSIVASIPEVRAFLLEYQRMARLMPGLVTDGRDMGSVIFPDASLKIFLTADLGTRAQRRYEQVKARHQAISLEEISACIRRRDDRDRSRTCSPFIEDPTAFVIDTSQIGIEEVVEIIIQKWYSSVDMK